MAHRFGIQNCRKFSVKHTQTVDSTTPHNDQQNQVHLCVELCLLGSIGKGSSQSYQLHLCAREKLIMIPILLCIFQIINPVK